MKSFFFCCLLMIVVSGVTSIGFAQKRKKNNDASSFYSIRIYHFTGASQESAIDNYLSNAMIPALHRHSLGPIGVFKPITNDTASDKKIVVLMSAPSVQKLLDINDILVNDTGYIRLASPFIQADYNTPAFNRYESIILQAFSLAYFLEVPILNAPKEEHIYELRSYESATDGLYKNKVKMFNEGGEIALFKRLGFNAVFYGEVISGSRMPNLMYMTSFENRTARDDHWKAFGNDPFWKQLSSDPQYQHNVSKIDIWLMHAAPYSDY